MLRIEIDSAAAIAGASREVKIESRIQKAIRRTMQIGKAEAKSRIQERYTTKNPLSTGKVQSRVSGLEGILKFSGKRNQLRRFIIKPRSRPRRMPKGGVYAQVIKGQGGSLARAFLIRSGVFERVGRERLPIKNLKTIALPGMAKAVADKVTRRMDAQIETELQNL